MTPIDIDLDGADQAESFLDGTNEVKLLRASEILLSELVGPDMCGE